VKIENEVSILGTDSILATEANCRLGTSENGDVAFDINSPTCRQILAQVQRLPATDPLNPNGVSKSFPIRSTWPSNARPVSRPPATTVGRRDERAISP
jgi:hypothetical protein